MDERQIEKLEVLDGSRRREAIRKAAVRIEDLQALMDLPANLRSVRASGETVTRKEHDALVADIQSLHRTMMALQEALQGRIIP